MNALLPIAEHSQATKYYNLATFIIILYEHMITFDVEVEKAWKQQWSFPKFLWFVFRYLTPLKQFGSILADQLTVWTYDSCLQWLWWRFIADEIVTAAASVVLIIRIWVLFEKAHWPLAIMLSALLAQTVTTIWSWLAFTVAVSPPDLKLTGCYPTPKSLGQVGQVGSLFISLLVLGESPPLPCPPLPLTQYPLFHISPLLADATIFILAVIRIMKELSRPSHALPLLTMMMRDGVVYLMIICAVNLVNVILIEHPNIPTDLRPLNTEFTPIITVIMVSRLFLNLRTSARQTNSAILVPHSTSWWASTSSSTSAMIGNLGEPVQYNSKIEISVSTEVSMYADGDVDEGRDGRAILLSERRRISM